jgi:hypothetical protein
MRDEKLQITDIGRAYLCKKAAKCRVSHKLPLINQRYDNVLPGQDYCAVQGVEC